MPGSTTSIAKGLTSRGWISSVPTLLPRSGGDVGRAAVETGGGDRRRTSTMGSPTSHGVVMKRGPSLRQGMMTPTWQVRVTGAQARWLNSPLVSCKNLGHQK
jgi:hypothetical protein